jgi:hypothetical protein
VPEGATPKDGPSRRGADLRLVSALTGKPARQDVAMTGESRCRAHPAHRGVKENSWPPTGWASIRCSCRRKTPRPQRASPGLLNKLHVKLVKDVDQAIKYVIKGKNADDQTSPFVTSLAGLAPIRGPGLPEVALAGKSNVGSPDDQPAGGQQQARAHVIGTGKDPPDQHLRDQRVAVSGGPSGYGFARAPIEEKKKWAA